MVVRPVGSQTSCMADAQVPGCPHVQAQVRGCNHGEVDGKVLVE